MRSFVNEYGFFQRRSESDPRTPCPSYWRDYANAIGRQDDATGRLAAAIHFAAVMSVSRPSNLGDCITYAAQQHQANEMQYALSSAQREADRREAPANAFQAIVEAVSEALTDEIDFGELVRDELDYDSLADNVREYIDVSSEVEYHVDERLSGYPCSEGLRRAAEAIRNAGEALSAVEEF